MKPFILAFAALTAACVTAKAAQMSKPHAPAPIIHKCSCNGDCIIQCRRNGEGNCEARCCS